MSISTTRILPTTDTKLSFKAKLREYKPKFSSPILSGRIEEIEGMLVTQSTSAGITSDTAVDVRLFDYGETVGIGTTSGDIDNTEGNLIYFPGLEGDQVLIAVGVQTATMDFIYSNAVTVDGQNYTLDQSFAIGGQLFHVRGAGGALIQAGGAAPTYTVTPSATNVDEGSTIDFVVNTQNVGVGTTLYYATLNGSTGTTASSSDLADSLTGSFEIVSDGTATGGIATITRSIASDFDTEGAETFRLEIRTGSITGTAVTTTADITINDIVSTFNVTPSTTNVSEGSSVTFTVDTTNVATGTKLYWKLVQYGSNDPVSTQYGFTTVVYSGDFEPSQSSGNFIITNNVGIVTLTPEIDWLTENEGFSIEIRTGSTSGTITTTSSVVRVTDTFASDISVTPSSTTVDEDGSVTFTVTGTNIPDSTRYYATIVQGSGIITADDFSNIGVSGNYLYKQFSITNNTGSFTINLTEDGVTEGIETFYVEVRFDTVTGTLVGTSPTITINDTSKNPGAAANGLTFGPVIVNRDNGVVANATDWYKICKIDDLPEGSSIALFIDDSGSMTQATVQASYELLVSKLAAKNITITTVTNSQEDWITPFLVDLP